MIKILIFFGFSLLFNQGECQVDVDAGLRSFLNEKMQSGFSEWILVNGLDPTEPISKDFDLRMTTGLFTLNMTLSQVAVKGWSNLIYVNSARSSFLRNEIDVIAYLSINLNQTNPSNLISLFGRYNGTGTVLGMYPLGGSGNWEISSSNVEIQFYNRFHLENGYIVISEPTFSVYNEFRLTSKITGSFENMFSNDTASYQQTILETIAAKVQDLTFERIFVYPHIYNYLSSLFKIYTATEIINWPTPTGPSTSSTEQTSRYPSTTSRPTSTETDLPVSSTISPCIAQQLETEDELRSTGLNNFLENSMNNYGEWLINNRLDPTPPILSIASLNIDNSFLRLDGMFRNTIGSGMSTQVYVGSVSSDLLKPGFRFGIDLRNVAIYGNYNASGSIISMYPITGEGYWNITSDQMYLDLLVVGFAIEDGFINIDKYEERYAYLESFGESQLIMPDLITPEGADGLGKDVLEILAEAIPKMLHDQEKHPVIKSVLDYLRFLFMQTPFTEIVASTRPPCIF